MKHFRISDSIVFSIDKDKGYITVENEPFKQITTLSLTEMDDMINVYQSHQWVRGEGSDTNNS